MPRRCPSCDAKAPVRSARWCSSCGAALAGPTSPTAAPSGPASRGNQRSRLVVAGIALAVLLVAGAAVLAGTDRRSGEPGPPGPPPASDEADVARGPGEVELPPGSVLDDLLDDEWAVEPGSAAVVLAVDGSPTEASPEPARPTCDVDGCALWRGTLLGTGPVAIGERQAVTARDGLLVTVDLETGELRWRVPQPLRDRQVQALHLDERVVAVATGTTVTVLDPRTGGVRGTSPPLPVTVLRFARFDGQLVGLGSGPDGMVAVGLDDRAQLRFVRDGAVDALSTSAATPLLVEHDGHIRRLDATTGSDRWAVPLDGRLRDGLTLLDRTDGSVAVLDPRTGAPLLTLVVPGAVAAGVRSGVLVVVTPDRLMLTRRDGTVVEEVAGLDPTVSVVTATGRRVTVVEVPSGGAEPRVEVRQVPGEASGLPGPSDVYDVPGTDVFSGEMGRIGRELGATRRQDGFLVASTRAAWLVPSAGEVARSVAAPVGERVRHVDGLSVRLLPDGLDLGGARGRLRVRGAWEVLSLDPFLVRGPQGTLRLDRRLLDG